MSVADHIRTIGSAVTIATGIVVAAFFFAKLDARVGRLEEQVHALNLAPTLAPAGKQGGAVPPQPIANPVAQACADLAKTSADEIGKGFLLNADRIQKTMAEFGCTRSP